MAPQTNDKTPKITKLTAQRFEFKKFLICRISQARQLYGWDAKSRLIVYTFFFSATLWFCFFCCLFVHTFTPGRKFEYLDVSFLCGARAPASFLSTPYPELCRPAPVRCARQAGRQAFVQLLRAPPFASLSSFILATRFLNSSYWHFS